MTYRWRPWQLLTVGSFCFFAAGGFYKEGKYAEAALGSVMGALYVYGNRVFEGSHP